MDDLEFLDEDIRALLDSEKQLPELAPTTKAALFARVSTRVGMVPPPQGNGGGDGSGGTGTSSGAEDAIRAGGSAGTVAVSGVKAVTALVATFALGIATGVAVDRRVTPPLPVPTATVAVLATAPGPPPSIAEEPGVPIATLPSAPAPAARPAPASTSADTSASPSPSARGLGAERALLDVARGALARGEAQEAFVAAERHAADYPNGALVEEREALAIKALVALGRRDEARKRAAEMERRFPNGLMLRSVKNAVGSAP